jgi:hypothetical protein
MTRNGVCVLKALSCASCLYVNCEVAFGRGDCDMDVVLFLSYRTARSMPLSRGNVFT